MRTTKPKIKPLGMNARNLNYIRPLNSKRAIKIADNKLLSKKILSKAGLPTLQTYGVIRNRKEFDSFDWGALPPSFVVKPNRGLTGAGVLIVYGRKKKASNVWVQADRAPITVEDLRNHIFNILDGNYSLTSLPDAAIIEERLKLIKTFKPYTYRGVPDIRIIVFNHIPIMAELRIPTKESSGKSNLHLGGIGVGIDLGTGTTTAAIHHNKLIERLPEKKLSLSGIKVPHWQELLELAVECQTTSRVGYMGADIALDRDRGPVVVELNARPGLSIQIANLSSLDERLKRVAGLKIKTAKRGIKIAQDLFGGEIETELEEISGKKVIGINEPIEIVDSGGTKHQTWAKIDTGAYRTTLCSSLAEKYNLIKIIRHKKVRGALGAEERPMIDFSFFLDKRLVTTEAFIANRQEMKYDIIVGRRDLKRFLVDPAKNVFMKSQKKL